MKNALHKNNAPKKLRLKVSLAKWVIEYFSEVGAIKYRKSDCQEVLII